MVLGEENNKEDEDEDEDNDGDDEDDVVFVCCDLRTKPTRGKGTPKAT